MSGPTEAIPPSVHNPELIRRPNRAARKDSIDEIFTFPAYVLFPV